VLHINLLHINLLLSISCLTSFLAYLSYKASYLHFHHFCNYHYLTLSPSYVCSVLTHLNLVVCNWPLQYCVRDGDDIATRVVSTCDAPIIRYLVLILLFLFSKFRLISKFKLSSNCFWILDSGCECSIEGHGGCHFFSVFCMEVVIFHGLSLYSDIVIGGVHMWSN